jgi:two-component system, NarL family, sensor histidine kinase DevS
MEVLTREQLEERLAVLHQASLEVVRDLSLDNVLERIIQLALQQAGARYAALGLVDDQGKMVQFIPVGLDEEEKARIGHHPVGKGMIGALMDERRTIRIPDISTDPRSYGFPPYHPQMGSFLGVPIILGDELLGVIYLTDKEDLSEFNESDERVIETLAAYAAVAINNARLYKKMVERDQTLTKRNEDLALINDLAVSLTQSLELDEILDRTLSRVMNYLEVEAGEIFLSEDGGKYLRLALHQGEAPDAFWTRDRFNLGEGCIGQVAQTKKPMISFNPGKDLRFLRQAVIQAGFNCIACIPLIARGNLVGVMSIASRSNRNLDESRISFLASIGAWAGIMIENSRLHRQARRLAVLDERERIGMDLHDGIIQSIYAVGLALDFARNAVKNEPETANHKIEQAIDGLNNVIRDIRTYILDLRPRQFRGEDLLGGLHQLVDEFRANSRAEATIVSPKDGLVNVPTVNTTALFHICQEALANVAKHSKAYQANVHLWTTRDRVILEVSDDGQGFDQRKVSATLGHGLSNMVSRARKVGGDVEITSNPGGGTNILAWVPKRTRV